MTITSTKQAREMGRKSAQVRREKAEERQQARKRKQRTQKKIRAGMSILEAMELWPEFKADSWRPWKVFLRALFGLPMSEAELEVFVKHTARQTPKPGGYTECWNIVGRRGGKSRIAGLVAVYLALFRDYSKVLDIGEQGVIIVLAADRRQARTVHSYVRGFVNAVPTLQELVSEELTVRYLRETVHAQAEGRDVLRAELQAEGVALAHGKGSRVMPRKKKLWSYAAGARGHTVTVCERKPDGILWARAWDPARKRYQWRSLKHRDKNRAKEYALAESQRLLQGKAEMVAGRLTVGQLLDLYLEQKSPTHKPGGQDKDRRCAELWRRYLGSQRQALDVDSSGLIEAFIANRTSGAMDGRGNPVAEALRVPVGPRAVEADLLWLCWVYNWGTNRKHQGQPLLASNPMRLKSLKQSVDNWPQVKNVRRPVASTDRYEKVRAVSDQIQMVSHVNGRQVMVRSHLSEVLDLSYSTGRRLSAIVALWFSDYMADYQDENGNRLPYGAIRWRGSTDKMGREWTAPINRTAQKAIERILRERPGLGDAPMFPSAKDPSKPIPRYLPDHWLREAEKLAGLETQDGSAWHAYRRGWATGRKHLSPTDVAHAGGWKTIHTMQAAYQHADMSTMLLVVTEPAEIRERKA